MGADPGDPTLRALLEEVAINGEVLVAVTNHALINPEGTYGMGGVNHCSLHYRLAKFRGLMGRGNTAL